MMVCAHVCVYALSPLSLLLCYCVLYVNLFWCKTEWFLSVCVCVCLPVCVCVLVTKQVSRPGAVSLILFLWGDRDAADNSVV